MLNAPSIFRVREFPVVGPYALRVAFDDGTEQVIDFQPVLGGELFGPLRDISLFNQVLIDPEVHTLVWANGADFDPDRRGRVRSRGRPAPGRMPG